MPKIGKQQFKIDGKFIDYELHYNRKEGFFFKDFPDKIYKIGSDRGRYFNTEDDLIKSTEQAIYNYHKVNKTRKKVILYSIKISSDIAMNKVGRGHYNGMQKWIPSEILSKIKNENIGEGFGFLLDHEVVYRVDDNGAKYYYEKEKTPLSKEGDDVLGFEKRKRSYEFEIEYTEKREEFFNSIEEQTKNMVKKIVEFLAQDEEKLLKIFEGGEIKMLG